MKEPLRNENVRSCVGLSSGKIVGGKSKTNTVCMTLKKITDQMFPTSLNELRSLGRAAIKVGTLFAILIGTPILGLKVREMSYHPEEAEVYNNQQVIIDDKYQLLIDPNSNPDNDPNKPTIYRIPPRFKRITKK